MAPFSRPWVAAPPLQRGEGVTYNEFKVFVLDLAERDDLATNGLLPIPVLRREWAGPLSRAAADALLIQMHGEGAAPLPSHPQVDTPPPALRPGAPPLPSRPGPA